MRMSKKRLTLSAESVLIRVISGKSFGFVIFFGLASSQQQEASS
jgi:hypothetical protein